MKLAGRYCLESVVTRAAETYDPDMVGIDLAFGCQLPDCGLIGRNLARTLLRSMPNRTTANLKHHHPRSRQFARGEASGINATGNKLAFVKTVSLDDQGIFPSGNVVGCMYSPPTSSRPEESFQ